MKLTKLGLVALILTIALVINGCHKSLTSSVKKQPRGETQMINYQIYDTKGQLLPQKIQAPPKQVMVIGQSIAETMSYFGLEDRIQSISYLEDSQITNKKLQKVPVLAKLWPSKEAVLTQKPDLLYSLSTAFDGERIGSINSWNQRGIPVITTSNYVNGKTIDYYLDEIKLMGKVFGIQEQTTDYILK